MVFIDGSNLYHVLGENCGRHDLQFDKFAAKLANGRDLRRIYYYNIKQESERQPDIGRDQDKFLSSLYDTPYMEVRLGIWKQRGEEMIEKGVDVMLATDLVVKALKDQYDTAIVVSGDADFFPAIQAAKDAGKHVEIAAFDSNLSPEAARAADAHIKLTKSWCTGLWMTRRGGDDEVRLVRDREQAPRGGRRRITRTTREASAVEEPAATGEAAIHTVKEEPTPSRTAPAPEQTPAPAIRRTPARRRVGGTVPPSVSVNGHSATREPDGQASRPTSATTTAGRSDAGDSATPHPAEDVQDTSRPSTARRAGWLRRLGLSSEEGQPENTAPVEGRDS
jgi:uncharacterized LabA/DUF88 family protein